MLNTFFVSLHKRKINSIKMASFKISLNLLLISAFFFSVERGSEKHLSSSSSFGNPRRRGETFLSSCVETLVECIVTTWRPPLPSPLCPSLPSILFSVLLPLQKEKKVFVEDFLRHDYYKVGPP